MLVILTNVKQVEINYNMPNASKICKISVDEIKKYIVMVILLREVCSHIIIAWLILLKILVIGLLLRI